MSYQHLSTYERGCIETFYKLGYSNRKIALELGRHHSTIDRERVMMQKLNITPQKLMKLTPSEERTLSQKENIVMR